MTAREVDPAPRAVPRFAATPVVIGSLALDLACIAIFVALGKENHGVHRGIGWFFNVWWPLAVGLIVGALITRLYVAHDHWPLRLLATVTIAVIVGGPLRTLTGRVVYTVFTLVAFGMLNLLMFAWRLSRIAARQARGAPVST